MTQFDQQFKDAILRIMNQGFEEYNERTGHSTKIIPGLTFELDQGFPLLTLRKIPIKIFVAEQIWYIMGSQKPDEFVGKFTKIWDAFTEQDGTIPAAYGHRWRSASASTASQAGSSPCSRPSPSAQRTASAILDLPEPFGPTTAVIPEVKSKTVF